MDEAGRRAARRRAVIAFIVAGVLVMVSVAGLMAVDRRHDRFERIRDRVEDELGRWGDRMVPRRGPGSDGDQSGRWDQGSNRQGELPGRGDHMGPRSGPAGAGGATGDGNAERGQRRRHQPGTDSSDGPSSPTPSTTAPTTTAPAPAGGI